MNKIILVIGSLAFLWFFIVFFLSRIFIPFLRFKRYPVPEKIPEDMQTTIDKLRKESENKEEFLKKTYEFLTKKYHGGSLMTIIRVKELFVNDLDTIWNKKNYVPCTTHNYLIRVFLLKSGLFSENDIKIVHTTVFLNIHQYLKVKVNGKFVDVDPAADHYGLPYGVHITPFPLKSLPRLWRSLREE